MVPLTHIHLLYFQNGKQDKLQNANCCHSHFSFHICPITFTFLDFHLKRRDCIVNTTALWALFISCHTLNVDKSHVCGT